MSDTPSSILTIPQPTPPAQQQPGQTGTPANVSPALSSIVMPGTTSNLGQGMFDVSNRYANVGGTIYDKNSGQAFSNPQDFFKASGTNSFNNLKFDTAWTPQRQSYQPAPQQQQAPQSQQFPQQPQQQQTSAPYAGPAGTTPPPGNGQQQTFSLGNGQSYDVNGNPVAAQDPNQQIAQAAGQAGLSTTDYLNLLGSQTATNSSTRQDIYNQLGIPQAQTSAFSTPDQSTVDVYNQGYQAAGLGDLKQKILDMNNQIAAETDQYNQAVGKENENPFLSESARVGRVQNLYNTQQATMANLLNEQNNYQNLYAQGVNEVNNLVTRHTNDFTLNQAVNQQKLSYLVQQAETQETAAQNTKTQDLISRYFPQYLQQSAQTQAAEKPFGTPQTGLFTYNPQTKSYTQVSPPVGQYSPITTPTGNVYGFNANTGQVNPTNTNTFSGQSGSTSNALVQPTSTLSQLLGTYTQGPNSTTPVSSGYMSTVVNALQSAGVNVNANTPVSQLQQYIPQIAQAIPKAEGYGTAGAPSITQANDPGAIEWAAAQQYGLDKQFGATPFKGANGITYAGFSSPQVGMQALQSYLGSIMGAGSANQSPGLDPATLTQAFNNIAPSLGSSYGLAATTFNGYLKSGNLDAASQFLTNQAYKQMQPATQNKVDNTSQAIDAYTQALAILNKHPELSTGVYQNIVQSAKPWTGTNATKDYQQFNQLMNIGNSLLENGLYGIRLNPTDISQSASFQPNQQDPTATVVTKLKGAIGFFNYAQAKTYNAQIGMDTSPLQTFLQQAGYQQ